MSKQSQNQQEEVPTLVGNVTPGELSITATNLVMHYKVHDHKFRYALMVVQAEPPHSPVTNSELIKDESPSDTPLPIEVTRSVKFTPQAVVGSKVKLLASVNFSNGGQDLQYGETYTLVP